MKLSASRCSFALKIAFLSLFFIVATTTTSAADTQPPKSSKSSQQKQKSTGSTWEVDPQTILLFEIIVATLVVAYIITYIIGTRQNLNVARKIALCLNKSLALQFVKFECQKGKTLIRDGSSFFWYFATGRRYTPGLTVAIDLAKRMDLFLYTSAFMSVPQKDKMIFYLPISDDVQMEALTLFMIKRKELTRLRNNNIDSQKKLNTIDQMATNVIDLKGIPSDIILMTEHNDIANTLLTDPIRQIISNHSNYILSIHVTEQGSEWDPQSLMARRLIRVEFTLPYSQSKYANIISDMAKLTLHLLDTVGTAKLTPAARKSVSDLRKKAALELEKREQKARAEAAANRRIEKKKKEEEAVGKMSAQKQRKYEEKKRKKEVASRMRKAIKK